jgi:hypothetical protein
MEVLKEIREAAGCGYDGGSGIGQVWFGCKVNFPEAIGCTVSDDDGYPLMEYRDISFSESDLASLVAKEANRKECVVGQSRKDVGPSSCEWQAGKEESASVGRLNDAAIRKVNFDRGGGAFDVVAGSVYH